MPKLKLKTSKSALKRFKVTSKGKMEHRHTRMNHFNAKQTGSSRRNKRPQETLAKSNDKDIKNLMPYI
jgi:large subunit ribosomal protein L35